MLVNRKDFNCRTGSILALVLLFLAAGVHAVTLDGISIQGASGVTTSEQEAPSVRAAESLFRSSVPQNDHLWTFDQITHRVLLEHPAILAKRSAAEAARADVDAAKWERFPTPAITADKSLDERFVTPARNIDPSKNTDKTFILQQPLWSGGRITYSISAAKFRYGESQESIHEVEENILLAIANAFVEASRWQAHKAVRAESLQQHQHLYEMIKRRVQAEASPQVDLDLAQGRLYQSESDLSYAEQMMQSALLQLSQLAGSPVGAVAALEGALFSQLESQEKSVSGAQAQSPVLARLAHAKDAAEADVNIKKSAYWPQLALRYEKQTGPFTYNLDRLMLTANMQIGAGLSIMPGVEAARARAEAAALERESATRDLAQQVSVDWSNYVAARARVVQASKASLISDIVFESYTRQYTAGRKSWLDVMNSVREASQSKDMIIDVYAQMIGSGLRLLVLTGRLHPAALEEPLRYTQ